MDDVRPDTFGHACRGAAKLQAMGVDERITKSAIDMWGNRNFARDLTEIAAPPLGRATDSLKGGGASPRLVLLRY